MTDEDQRRQWEEALIADAREHDGRPASGPLAGHPLMVMYSRGAKSGERRRAILTFSREGDDYIVAGTAGGAKTDPQWVGNLRADPEVTFEIGKRTFAATATVAHADDAERQRLWDQHAAELPWFADYPAQTGRTIPMVRLSVRR